MMNKKASMMVEVMVFLVIVVLTSAVVLLLVQKGVIQTKTGPEVPILNAEFIPVQREGILVMKEFDFCTIVDKDFNCLDKTQSFTVGDNVYIRFLVESSSTNGHINLVRNYRLLDPNGIAVLELDDRNNYYFEEKSAHDTENVAFANYFTTGKDFKGGDYTLEVIIENPLANKRLQISKKFTLFNFNFRE